MITYDTVNAWGVSHPWISREQIEQDLLLSKAICEIYSNEFLSSELIFRGGTALHKLILSKPYRYSEDLDFVRTSSGGIGNIMNELTKIGIHNGFKVKTKMGQYPKVYWNYFAQTGISSKIKIEINTYERNTALPMIVIDHSVSTEWYKGSASIKVFQTEEIAATKIRALYQRSKGRDLFDLWLLTTIAKVNPENVINAFVVYRPEDYSSKKAIENLERKLLDSRFLSDMDSLIASNELSYSVSDAATLVKEIYLEKL